MHSAISELNNTIDNFDGQQQRPLIAISANRKDGLSSVAEPYYKSVILAGGTPLIVPVCCSIEVLSDIVEIVDGVLFTGGGDIDPLFFEEKPVPELDGVDTLRDEYDFTMLRLAYNRQLPIMGICRGHQVINVAFGGTLCQHIRFHSQAEPKHLPSHKALLYPSSLKNHLSTESLNVNSLHHQAVKDVAEGFVTSAISPEGINEAIEHYDYEMFSVQWHPEQMAVCNDAQMLSIFKKLINAASVFQLSKKIHQSYCSIDSHTDTPLFFELGYNLNKKNIVRVTSEFLGEKEIEPFDYEVKVDVPKMRWGLIDAVCMAVYIPQAELDANTSLKAVNKAFQTLRDIKRQIERNEKIAAQAITTSDIMQNKADKKKSILIGIENGYALGKDVGNVELFAREGIVYITLCHNGANDVCDSAIGTAVHNGLSVFGKRVVVEMNRCGVMVDISHTSEKTSFDVLELSASPVIASHSSVKALCNHPRNISDSLLKAVADRGGVIQVCLYSSFLHPSGKATYRDVVDHISYIVDKVGIDYVGIGSDFDGCDNSAGLQGIHQFMQITQELIRRGYKEQDIAKIISANFMRVMNEAGKLKNITL
jgi:microsomal dipeptidase-like Zn-dependent dipeptidase/gamma-glutamyl-gamma-aminobutyrate hydrolase PuuD